MEVTCMVRGLSLPTARKIAYTNAMVTQKCFSRNAVTVAASIHGEKLVESFSTLCIVIIGNLTKKPKYKSDNLFDCQRK